MSNPPDDVCEYVFGRKEMMKRILSLVSILIIFNKLKLRSRPNSGNNNQSLSFFIFNFLKIFQMTMIVLE